MDKPNYNIFFNKPCYSKQYTKNIDSHFENNDCIDRILHLIVVTNK